MKEKIEFREIYGKRQRGKEVKCDYCGEGTFKRLKDLRDYENHYCSRECSQKGARKRVTVSCAWCSKDIERTRSNLKKSRSGLFFCDRKCKAEAQKLGSGIDEIKPDHYGRSNGVLAGIANVSDEEKICIDCGETRIYMLTVHHIDGDRTNSDPNNIEVVCRNHHAKRHLVFADKKWRYSSSKLTPREKLKEIE